MMIAQVCDLELGDFVHTMGDAHLYTNHLEQTDLQLSRSVLPLPQMKLNPQVKDIFSFKFEDFELWATSVMAPSRHRSRSNRDTFLYAVINDLGHGRKPRYWPK